MPHVIEAAKSGRASCRKCKDKIVKGELRFGHEVANTFDAGAMTLQWYHLKCAAEKLPVELSQTLDSHPDEIPDRDELLKSIEENRKNVKPSVYPYSEYSPSGRAGCAVCGEKLAKDELRIAVEREIDAGGFTRMGAAYLHPACAADYDELPNDLMAQLRANSTQLEDDDFTELESQIS